jgi:hypothetical protein
MARCPSHPDKNPSLSIKEENDRILLTCWAGCAAAEIVKALGLHLKDLFLDSGHSRQEIERAERERAQKRATRERWKRKWDAEIDARREAERLIRSAKNIPDSDAWSDDKRNKILNQLADAYLIIEREPG